jgi:hypothetical protein
MWKALLFRHSRPWQLVSALTGTGLGLLLLLSSIQVYLNISEYLNGGDINQPRYMVINKRVNMLNTLFGGQKGFSAEELDNLKKIKGVRNAAGLTSSQFKVNMSMEDMGMEGIPQLQTELFFESVPAAFADNSITDFKWTPGDSVIPVVLPRDYIKLYNFGFAPSQGLPQLTESMVGLATFRIRLKGPKGQANFKGKLAGFAERVNSILVPQTFLDAMNSQLSGIESGKAKVSRVILECEGAMTGDLHEYFTENGYETGEDVLRNAKLSALLKTIMSFLAFVGAVIVLISLLGFVLYSQLVINRSTYEIETLSRLGVTSREMITAYLFYYGKLMIGLLVLAIASTWIISSWFAHYLKGKGFEIDGGISISVLIMSVLFVVGYWLLQGVSIVRSIRKIAL